MIRQSNSIHNSNNLKANRAMLSNGNAKSILHSRIENEEVIFEKYEKGSKLGQGSFGVVYEMTNKQTGEKVALKIINKEKAGNKSQFSYEKEVEIMKTVTHPNLVKLEEVFESKKKLYLVTELCEHGELAKWIKSKSSPTPESESKHIMKQIVAAISYLHKNGIVHRDLKLENILIKDIDLTNNECYIKITDFGLSSHRETVGTESMFDDYCGTPLYMAPEIIENHPYSQLCDVWALGIIMYILLTNHSPFTAESDTKLREQIRKAEINETSKNFKKLTPEAVDCLKRMMRVNPAHRIASSELAYHPWFLDKKISEMAESQMNVLELMSEMLQEEENKREEMNRISKATSLDETANTDVDVAKTKTSTSASATTLGRNSTNSHSNSNGTTNINSNRSIDKTRSYTGGVSKTLSNVQQNNASSSAKPNRIRSQIVSQSAHALYDYSIPQDTKISNIRFTPPTSNQSHLTSNRHHNDMPLRSTTSSNQLSRIVNSSNSNSTRRAPDLNINDKTSYKPKPSLSANVLIKKK